LSSSLIADENCHSGIINHLRASGFVVLSVREFNPGISDASVPEFAIQNKALLVTEDADFGN